MSGPALKKSVNYEEYIRKETNLQGVIEVDEVRVATSAVPNRELPYLAFLA